MAERFDFDSIYEEETWTIKLENADGGQEKFYDLVKTEVDNSEFPNLEVTVGEYVTGGLFFNKESTKMIKVKAKQSQFKKFEIYYRAQAFGNVLLLTRLECMERGFFSTFAGKSGKELKAELRKQCKNMAQYEEFVAIDSFANIIYNRALMQMDPNYKERRMLGETVK